MFARNFQVKLNQNEFNQKAKNSMTSEFVKNKLLNSFFSKIFVKTYQFLFSHTIDWGPSPSFFSNIGNFKRINQFLFPLKSSEDRRISDNFMGNKS